MLTLLLQAITVVTFFFVGALVYFRDRRNPIHISFGYMGLVISLWIGSGFISNLLVHFGIVPNLALSFGILLSSQSAASLVIFAWLFPVRTTWVSRRWILTILLLALAVGIVGFTPAMVPDSILVGGKLVRAYGPLYFVFAWFVSLACLYQLFHLFNKYRRLRLEVDRQKMKHVYFGFCTALPMIMFTMLVLPYFKISMFFFLGEAAALLFISPTTYAILRYRALDISSFARKTLYWFVLGVIYLSLIFVPFGLARPWLQEQDLITAGLFIALIAAAVMVFDRLGRPVLAQYIQRREINLSRVLEHFSRELGVLKSLDDLLRGIERILREELAVENLSLIIRENPRDFRMVTSWPVPYQGSLAAHYEFLNWLGKSQDIVAREQIEADPAYHSIQTLGSSYFSDLGVEVTVPLVFNRQLLGVVNLGPKRNQERYIDSEFHVLSILRHDLAIALSNSFLFEEVRRLYEEVKHFNQTLEQRVAERTAELEQAMHQLQHLDKLKSDFISMASHELRTPMTAVKGAISLAQESQQAGASGEALMKLLTLANRNVDRMIMLINDILDLSKLEAGQLTLQIEGVRMREVIQAAVDSLMPLAERKRLRVATQFSSESLEAMGDRARLVQVLVNLLGNAIKYSPPGEEVVVAAKSQLNMIECSVLDHGAGIEPTAQSKIFEKFGQAGHEFASPEEGTGLGLAIVREIVELHHGQVWVESQPGQGSKFTFRIPAKV
jgi:signal transduction histidine kinase